MPEIHGAKAGRFCWYELGTTDQPAAKRFYSELFGWTANDSPMGPDSVYTMFQLRGHNVGAAYTQMPDQVKQGVPPHWATYVAVKNADETAAKAKTLGGTVLAPPFDVFEFGRMAVLRDPTGAVISVWQAKTHQGAGLGGEPNTFCWSELMTRDAAAATKFYTSLFGWTTKVSDKSAIPYTHWQADGVDIGGMMQITSQMGQVPPHWINYVAVTDCDATVAKAQKLGGKVMMPGTDIPETGRFAILLDPQGAAFAIIALSLKNKG
jgi:predicted enzyme related to lactoylglutathione lyase